MTATRRHGSGATAKALLRDWTGCRSPSALFDATRRLAALGLCAKPRLKPGAPLAEFLRRDPGLKRCTSGAKDEPELVLLHR